MFDQSVYTKLFWIKMIITIITMGGIIGYFGYMRAKVPESVMLSNIVAANQATAGHFATIEHRLNTVEDRVTNLEQQQDRALLTNEPRH